MDTLAAVGWIILVVGSAMFWWSLLSRETFQSRKMPGLLVIGFVLTCIGFLVIADHETLNPGTHLRGVTIFAMLIPVLLLKVVANRVRAKQARDAALVSASKSQTLGDGTVSADIASAHVAPLDQFGLRSLADHLNVAIGISYNDAHGHHSDRTVIVHKVEGDILADGRPVPKVLHAYCSVAKAARTFKVERMTKAYDPDTGEIVTDLATYLFDPR